MKVLVVEDNPLNMKLACDLLEYAGHTVLSATAAEQGIALARQELPELILMDIQMPGMDGLTAAQLLKGDGMTSHIKVVALTALAMRGDKERILAAGCDGYIPKPIHPKEFFELVKSFEPGAQDAG